MKITDIIKETFCEKKWVIGIRILDNPDQSLYSTRSDVAISNTPFHIFSESGNITVADPYVYEVDNNMFLFFEWQNKSTREHKGQLRATLLTDCNVGTTWTILDEPFHLSYPYVFFQDEKCYLIPESSNAGELRLYETTNFPKDWNYNRCIKAGKFVDTNLLVDDNKLYFFTYENGRLIVMMADSLDDEPQVIYTSEKNKTLRGAGNIFTTATGEVIRPCQDCRGGYGKAIEFRQINLLSNLEGAVVKRIEPRDIIIDDKSIKNWQLGGLHTYNRCGRYEVIDLLIYRFVATAVLKNGIRFISKRLRHKKRKEFKL